MQIILKTVKQKRQNSKDWPEFYIARILEPGLVSYEDMKQGYNLLTKETILKILPSFKGRPIIDKRHQDVSPEDYEKYAVGYVTRPFYDDTINWGCVEFMLKDDEAKQSVADGYFVSCAYDNCQTSGKSGEWHAIPYRDEIIGGVGNHVALVDQPRYEGGIIIPCIEPCMMLVNSKKATIKDGEGKRNTLSRICNTCEHLENGACSIAGPGGELTKKYAELRLSGQEEECEGYVPCETRIEMTGNSVTIGARKENGKEPDREEMFKRERQEHPTFSDEDIHTIVEDHVRVGGDDVIYK